MAEAIVFLLFYFFFKVIIGALSGNGKPGADRQPPKKGRPPQLEQYQTSEERREGLIEWLTGNFH